MSSIVVFGLRDFIDKNYGRPGSDLPRRERRGCSFFLDELRVEEPWLAVRRLQGRAQARVEDLLGIEG